MNLGETSLLRQDAKLDYDVDDALSKVSIDKLLEYSYLNLQPNDFLELNNELLERDPKKKYENPIHELMDFMRQPENFAFTCKWLLGVDLLPIQVLILNELWRRKYPMFIATRGGSKSYLLGLYSVLKVLFCPGSKIIFVGAGFRQSKILFEYVEAFLRNSPIFQNIIGKSRDQGPKHDTDRHSFYAGDSVIHALPIGDGQKIRGMRATCTISDEFSCLERNTLIQTNIGLVKIADILKYDTESLLNKDNTLELPSHIIKTPKTDVYEIVTRNGYSFRCSDIHKVMTIDGFKLAKDLTTNDVLELDTNDYFPSEYIKDKGMVVDEKIGWLLGLLVSEGTNTNRNNIIITNTDKTLIDCIMEKFPEFNWKLYTKEAHIDNRGWKCKKSYSLILNNTELRTSLYNLGLDYVTSHNKEIPWCILQSPRLVVLEFLKGLYEGDGSGFEYTARGKKHVGVSYYSVSETLINQLQILLLKFNILSSKIVRKSKISTSIQYALNCRAKNACDIYHLLKLIKWKDLIVDASYFKRKPTIIKYGDRYMIQTTRGNRNKHLGIFDTEEECIKRFNDFWKQANECVKVKSIRKLDVKEVLYDFYLPDTHSFRGGGFIHHNSMVQDIFEVVIEGFSSVNVNPVEQVRKISNHKILQSMGMDASINDDDYRGNQTIISGTAYYAFNHFYSYWRRYKAIVESRGDKNKLEEIFNGEIPEKFDWRDFSVIRIPYDVLPEGMMDATHIAKAKALMHSSKYQLEYSAVFVTDSNGFFKRSLIESCVTPVETSTEKISFKSSITGRSGHKYVYGIDPASEDDNFTIVILELHDTHRRIVYGWSATKQKLRERLKKIGQNTSGTSYYSYCARKIRDLMKYFPTEHIVIDKQGGGIPLIEAFHHQPDIEAGECALWPYLVRGKDDPFWWEKPEKPTDNEGGLHIIHEFQFGDAKLTEEANHSLRKDLETKSLLFPMFDSVEIGLATENDISEGREYDTLEDCVLEIEELKNELSTITHTRTPSGRDKWSTPEVKEAGGRIGRLRKDRYSALVMANQVARTIGNTIGKIQHKTHGGYVSNTKRDSSNGPMYYGSYKADFLKYQGCAVTKQD